MEWLDDYVHSTLYRDKSSVAAIPNFLSLTQLAQAVNVGIAPGLVGYLYTDSPAPGQRILHYTTANEYLDEFIHTQ